ncbi:MAG: hypothetical protein COW84_06550 [Gammaproteobacteria bacterium CG22_combo_CG10-13_8_21_14_all_40_8]|nr:MAG: hypothetical protein COW84_06550 [Gammaproteobacteria bacterium CG22_combo_CG10-13_8_21_14_all_40_8]
MPVRLMRNIAIFASFLALIVVLLGAWTRLKDAGLGCPDWPGCYGQLTVPSETFHIEKAQRAFPDRKIEPEKAWAEMTHRYFASSLGFIILLMAGLSILLKKRESNYSIKLPLMLLGLVIFQGMLGMWTVTMKLNPAIVSSHLLMGMTTFALLVAWGFINHYKINPCNIGFGEAVKYQRIAVVGLIIVVLQIAFGAWTSSNYAAMVCTQLPICQGDWLANLRPLEAFQIWGHGADNYEYGVKSLEARTTIHVVHRLWAIVALTAILKLSWSLRKSSSNVLKNFSNGLVMVVIIQFCLGVSNIVFHLPLEVAVAHNGGGAVLFASLVSLNILLFIASNASKEQPGSVTL